jgi:hypothetical protein
MNKRHKVEFEAIKQVEKKVDVEFLTRTGERVSFDAHKKVPKEVPVSFYAKNKK